MQPPLQNIRLSQKEKDMLIRVKRATGIKHWNVLCRWAFCVSLADPTPLSSTVPGADSSVEMTWKTFGGPMASLYTQLLQHRCNQDGIKGKKASADHFRKVLQRGITQLSKVDGLEAFLKSPI